ncbi:hypothetical protein THMIRHAS_00940 [Thiosulfatimonas sediminis]|uniref:Outer membrane protein beta-barrel domain-containing protein n=1 Tax=Thiosulfatimonas sediminis TaxID=2675054 RepID=A0A6F8PRG9_9GAMM|nr:hypothetical protein [Thiosulfatimonas sediminis]BBP44721.1 hypothetical protein THMIRHAS_00940 [Thiosulfatimonas sediminis]
MKHFFALTVVLAGSLSVAKAADPYFGIGFHPNPESKTIGDVDYESEVFLTAKLGQSKSFGYLGWFIEGGLTPTAVNENGSTDSSYLDYTTFGAGLDLQLGASGLSLFAGGGMSWSKASIKINGVKYSTEEEIEETYYNGGIGYTFDSGFGVEGSVNSVTGYGVGLHKKF